MALGTTKRGFLKATAGWPFFVKCFFLSIIYLKFLWFFPGYTRICDYDVFVHLLTTAIPAVCVTITRTIRRPMLTREYRSWMGRY